MKTNSIEEQAVLIILEDDLPVEIREEENYDNLLPIETVAHNFFEYAAETLANGNFSSFWDCYEMALAFLNSKSDEMKPFRDLGLFFQLLKDNGVYEKAIKLIQNKTVSQNINAINF